jgi:hypothetical protein
MTKQGGTTMTLLEARAKLEQLAQGAYCDISVSIRGGKAEYTTIEPYTTVELYIDGAGRGASQHSFQEAFDNLEVVLCQGPKEELAATVTPFDNVAF